MELIEKIEKDDIKLYKLLINKYKKEFKKEPIVKKRQKPCGAKQISKILEEGIQEYCERENLTRNFARNRKLIELSKRSIPPTIYKKIMAQYNDTPTKPASFKDIMMYLSKHKLNSLTSEANLFI